MKVDAYDVGLICKSWAERGATGASNGRKGELIKALGFTSGRGSLLAFARVQGCEGAAAVTGKPVFAAEDMVVARR